MQPPETQPYQEPPLDPINPPSPLPPASPADPLAPPSAPAPDAPPASPQPLTPPATQPYQEPAAPAPDGFPMRTPTDQFFQPAVPPGPQVTQAPAPTPAQTPYTAQPTEPPQPQQPIDPLGRLDDNPKKSWLLWAGAAVVVLLIAGITWAVISKTALAPGGKDDQSATQSTTTNRFYMTKLDQTTQNQSLISVDPTTGKQTSQEITLNETFSEEAAFKTFSSDSEYTNKPFQASKDGATIAYSTVENAPLVDSETAASESNFVLLAGKPDSLQTLVSGKDPQAILDWRLTADGKEVYYLETDSSDPDKANLYSVNVVTSASKKVGELDTPQAPFGHSSLSDVTRDTSIRLYVASPDGIYEYKYTRGDDKTGLKKRQLPGDEQLSSFEINMLSPDGNHLIVRSTSDLNPKVYRLDVRSASLQTLYDPGTSNIAYEPTGWSADSKNIAFTVHPNDEAVGGAFEFQIVTYDITTNARTVILKDSASSPDLYPNAMYIGGAWSHDGAYLAYAQRDTIHFYDIATKKTVELDTQLNNEVLGQVSVGYGWTSATIK